jgi:carotenoid cleavage dioxygenase-like enzyme
VTTARAARPVPGAAASPHLAGLYAPVVAEVDVAGLEVVGALPAALEGCYLRNGPNPRFGPIGRYVYPLDGDGMVHEVRLGGGGARYRNRFVRTPAVVAEEAAGHALWAGITDAYRPGADLVGPALAGTVRELPDVNVVRHGGRLLALAESKRPFRLGPGLETLGPETFGGSLPAGITAHPKVDPRTGEMVVFCYHLTPPFLTWAVIRPDGTACPPAPVEGVDRPSLIHDMALTAHYLVLVVAPLFFDLGRALAGGSLLSWEPDHGTRVALIPRDGGPVRWCADDTFWTWHTANAHEVDDPAAGSPVVLDYVEWDAPAGLVPGHPTPGGGRLARARIDPAAGRIRRELLADDPVEFPRIDDRALTRRHPTVALTGDSGRPRLHPDAADTLFWFDPRTGSSSRWVGDDLAVGEMAHAPHPDSPDPADGWWLTFATHRATGQSWLLVIPAANPATGPQARVRMPVRVPLGLHGAWLPDHPETHPHPTGGTR